jgi:hypothetical protein
MKTTKRLVIAVLAIAAFAPALPTMAQYKPTGGDGITCSPKVRQMLDDRHAGEHAAALYIVAVNSLHSHGDGIAASPKVRAQMDERRGIGSQPTSALASGSTTSKKNDGIAASPKVRQQMKDRGEQPPVEVAPVK